MIGREEVKIYLIRHGEAKSAWNEDPDPGLSDKGKMQAKELVSKILPEITNETRLISSPLLRARETYLPLESKIQSIAEINLNFAEIPSPGIALKERKEWLRKIFDMNIVDLGQPQKEWRNKIIECFKLIKSDTLIFSHFMVINCVVGWINSYKKIVNFYPNNCSVTKIYKKDHKFLIEELGNEFGTIVQ